MIVERLQEVEIFRMATYWIPVDALRRRSSQRRGMNLFTEPSRDIKKRKNAQSIWRPPSLFEAALPLLLLITCSLTGCGGPPAPTTPAPDFVLAVSPQSVFVPIGFSSANLQVSVQALNGFNQAVTISVSGLPAGVTTTPNSPFNVNAGASQTLTFSGATGIRPALQQVSLQGASGAVIHSSVVSLSEANPVYAYVANGKVENIPLDANDIAEFAVDANTGSVSSVPGGPINLPEPPIDLTAVSSANGAFLFVLTATGPFTHLESFNIDSASGKLTLLQTTYPNPGGSRLATHPSGKFLFVQGVDAQGNSCLSAYLVDPTTGNLTESSCSLGGSESLVVAPPGHFAYGWTLELGTINIYSVNLNDGSLTSLQTVASDQTNPLGSDPFGRALYAGVSGCGGLLIWSIDPNSGSLTRVNTSFGPLCDPASISFTPNDSFAYLIAGSSNQSVTSNIYAAAVDPATGNLTNVPGSPFTSSLFGQVEPSQGKFLLGLGPKPNTVGSYAIDPATGALSQGSGTTAPLPEPAPVKMVIVEPAP